MKVFYNIIVVICILCSSKIVGQEVFPSTTFVKTSYHHKDFYSNENCSIIFYNKASNDFYIVIDFTKLKTGIDSLDEWLVDLEETRFVYQSHIDFSLLPSLNNHNFKTFHLKGSTTLNKVVKDNNVDLTLFEISEQGVLYRKTGSDYFDRIRANIQIIVMPKDFGINKKKHHLKKTIFINIGNGIINEFKPGMEHLINP